LCAAHESAAFMHPIIRCKYGYEYGYEYEKDGGVSIAFAPRATFVIVKGTSRALAPITSTSIAAPRISSSQPGPMSRIASNKMHQRGPPPLIRVDFEAI
jgi:hypothetical protein